MALFSKVKGQRFCAFCKSKRTIYVKKHLDLINVGWVVIFAFSAGSAVWGWWEPRSLVLLGLSVGVCEAFLYVRWRFSVVCTQCGFDPVMYRRSPTDASARVRAFYEDRIKDPHFLLGKSPLLEVYRRQLENKKRIERFNSVMKVPQRQATSPNPPSSSRI